MGQTYNYFVFAGLSIVRKTHNKLKQPRKSITRSQAADVAVYPTNEENRKKKEAETPHALQILTILRTQQIWRDHRPCANTPKARCCCEHAGLAPTFAVSHMGVSYFVAQIEVSFSPIFSYFSWNNELHFLKGSFQRNFLHARVSSVL